MLQNVLNFGESGYAEIVVLPLTCPKKRTDLQTVKLTLIRAAQRESFGKILKCIQERRTFEDALIFAKMKNVLFLCHIKKYVPFRDSEEILQVGGRMNYEEETGKAERHPAFLLHMHNVTKFFILN